VIANGISHIGGKSYKTAGLQTHTISIRKTFNTLSKWCCVLAVVCLSVMLLSLVADAQPTTDDITSCSASTLEEVVNMVKTIASNIEEIRDEMTNMKNSVKTIASNQQLVKDELTGVKRQLAACGCASAKSTTVNPIDYSTQSTHGRVYVLSCLDCQTSDGVSRQ